VTVETLWLEPIEVMTQTGHYPGAVDEQAAITLHRKPSPMHESLVVVVVVVVVVVANPKTQNPKLQTCLETATPSRVRFLISFYPCNWHGWLG